MAMRVATRHPMAAWAVLCGMGMALVLAAGGAARGAEAAAPVPAAKPAVVDAAKDGDGGLAGLSAEEVAALRETRAMLEALAADPDESEEMRYVALEALTRIHEALNDWGRPGLAPWYLDLLATTTSGRMVSELLKGGQAAARGGQYHLGGVHEFWARVDEIVDEEGKELPRQAESARKAFLARIKEYEKQRRVPSGIKPLTLPVKRVNLTALPKPYEEPKPPAKPKK